MARADVLGMGPQEDLYEGASAVAYSPPVTTATPDINRNNMEITETLGNRAPGPQDFGGKSFTVPLAGAFRPRSGGLILSNFFGPPVTTEEEEDEAWTHLYDPLSALPIYTSVWARTDLTHIAQGVILDKYEGVLGNTINFAVEANNYLLFDASCAARMWVPDPPAPSFTRDTSGMWSFKTVTVQMAVENGAYQSNTPCRAFSMSYNNNVPTDDFILGSTYVDSLAVDNIELTGSFTPTKDIKGHTRRAMVDSPENIKLKLIALGPEIVTGIRYKLEIELFQLETLTAPGNAINAGENLRSVEVSWRAVLNDATNKLVTLKLTNDQDGELYQAAA